MLRSRVLCLRNLVYPSVAARLILRPTLVIYYRQLLLLLLPCGWRWSVWSCSNAL